MITGTGILDISIVSSGGTIFIRCSGELDVASEEPLAEAIFEVLQIEGANLVLDFRPLRFADTTVLRAFDFARRIGRQRGVEVSMLKGPAVARVVDAIREAT